MSKELIERLRSEWRKPNSKPPEMCEAADHIEQLEAENAALKAEVAHWKSNHATEVRRARILKERTDMPIERVDAYEQWGKDQVALKEAQEAAEFNFQQYQDAGRLLCEAHEQLAASQAREVQLRDALSELVDLVQDIRAGEYAPDSFTCQAAIAALALPSDTTALEALIAKAGDVAIAKARQACIDLGAKGIDYFNYTAFVEAIRALPGVKLEDLK